jgi:hypothetical protein
MHLPTRSEQTRARPRSRRTWRSPAGVLLALALVVGGCGDDDDGDQADDGAEDAEDVAESAGARGVAEVLRASLIAEERDDEARRGEVTVLRDAVENLPGEPDVAGIEDGDGDGRDDDGRVEVRVDDEVACLTISPEGDVDVSGGRC